MCIPHNCQFIFDVASFSVNFVCAIMLSLLSLASCRHAYLARYMELFTFSIILYSQLTNVLILFKCTLMRFFKHNVQMILI